MLTKQEAKEKCIKMWEHIAEHITDAEWRDGVSGRDNIKLKAFYALNLFQFVPEHCCFLCECGSSFDCGYCPLATPHCDHEGQPYNSFNNHIKAYHYARASAAATRLVEKVRAWEVGE